MGEYFKGWKRKTGVVTLLMALCLSGGWIRSLIVEDNLHTPFLTLHIHGGTIAWFDSQNVGWRWDTKEINADNWTGFGGVWRWNKSAIAAPYWIFILTVMLLSAYLLLAKPRKPVTTKAAEPNASEGA